jgi:hypothetical protein
VRPAFVTSLACAAAGFIVLVGVGVAVEQRSALPPEAASRATAAARAADAVPPPAHFPDATLFAAGGAVQTQDWYRSPSTINAFYFTRGIYSGGGRGGRGWGRRSSWAVDFPKADLQFVTVLQRLARIDVYQQENAITLDDPALRRFPFLYMLEVGSMALSPEEQAGLRGYLLAGGFLLIDDFWGSREWANWEYEIRQVLPEFPMVELTLEHPIFQAYYEIDEILQVPSINNIRWGQTSEGDGIVPHVYGIHDDKGRLMVLINWNTDLGDAWEWAEQPDYPLKYSTYAFQIAVNFIIYAMSH